MSIDSHLALYTAAGVRALDEYAIGTARIAGLTLMRRAATACVEVLRERWPRASRVLVCCGSGNNAGDGYLVAGMLADKGLDVTAVSVGHVDKLGSDGREAYHYCCSTGVTFRTLDDISIDGFDVIVDALLGTGIKGQVRADYLEVIAPVNQSNRPVLAVDIPSGLCADTGMRLGDAISAEVTVTFIGRRQGLYTLDGPDCAGELYYADLGVPPETFDAVPPDAMIIDLARSLAALPPRPKNAHKNTFGHVLVIGGDEGMGGAVSMCAETALRAGAGLVSVATHPSHVNAILARRPELMVRGAEHPDDLVPLLARASVVALGAGLGRSSWSSRMFKKAMEVTRDEALPVVLDADGLNLLAMHSERRDDWVLTPHPGEASNLLQDNRIGQDRFASVRRLKERFGGVVLLKGAGTLVAEDDGISVCTQGNPGMATAGMGDVLEG
ncbi:MAG: NAD(P)H-hydrate dehydratase [Gammaproteobacteria bacterium]|nr:NAD(P)H-hydrate dehydratase [Gammaproteobacteria bacterium]